MCSENHIDPRILRLQRIDDMLLLHHATADADCEILSLLHLLLFQLPQRAEKPFVRIFPDTAGIENNDVRIFSFLRLYIAPLQQHTRQRFRIMLVHLTAEGCNMK